MTTIPQVAQAMQTVLTSKAEAAGQAAGFTKRPDKAKLSASTFTQTLVFGWLAHPDATLEQLAASAARVGVEISAQALEQRFTPRSAACLRQVLADSLCEVVAAEGAVDIPLLQRFSAVVVQDGTTIVLPEALEAEWQGCGGSTTEHTTAALKCGVQLDLLSGQLRRLDLASGRTADRSLPVQRAELPEGSLRLADMGFYDLDVLAKLSAAKVYWLSRVRTDASVHSEEHGRLDLLSLVQKVGESGWEGWVWVGTQRRLRARLLIEPVPQEVADQRRRRLRKEAQDKGRAPSAAALALAAWTILITNAPVRLMSRQEALAVMRVRWQIELLFKLWKSQGQIDQWRSQKPYRILCEVYAKLIAMVIQHWALVVSCWSYADRSLVKASGAVRDQAHQLASARGRLPQLIEALQTLCCVVRRSARINPRSKHPNTYQVLLALTTTDE